MTSQVRRRRLEAAARLLLAVALMTGLLSPAAAQDLADRLPPKQPDPQPPASPSEPPQPQPPPQPPLPPPAAANCDAGLVLRERTAERGLERFTTTFGHAMADIDGDGDDDLLISTHGRRPPALMLNEGGYFVDASFLLPFRGGRDTHSPTVIDLDNDGDRDVLIAGGGGGVTGAGPGTANEVARNLLTETGELGFEAVELPASFSLRQWRGRHLLPLPSPSGAAVDIYFLTKERPGQTNTYLRNTGGREIGFAPRAVPGLDGDRWTQDGYDISLDFDRDGRIDLLTNKDEQVQILANRGGRYEPMQGWFEGVDAVVSAAAGDLDGDGYPDLYLGRRTPPDPSDRVISNDRELHFLTFGHAAEDADGFSFVTSASELELDLVQQPGLAANRPDTIYIGASRAHPPSRVFTISAADAAGKPEIRDPGVYLWKEISQPRWHLHVRYADSGDHEAGVIRARPINDLRKDGLEEFPGESTADLVFRNLGGGGFEPVELPHLTHGDWSRSVTMVDLDNNGWLDIAVMRSGQWGQANAQSLVLMNCGGFRFAPKPLPNPGARLFQAGELTYGFVDDDGLPDLFFTNGWGLAPGNRGPHRLLMNETPTAGDFVLLELVGRRSNRDALGARVELLDEGGRRLAHRQLLYRGRAQDSQLVHFGLGDRTGRLFARVHWPGGGQVTRLLARGARNRLIEPETAAISAQLAVTSPPRRQPVSGRPPTADGAPPAAAPAPRPLVRQPPRRDLPPR